MRKSKLLHNRTRKKAVQKMHDAEDELRNKIEEVQCQVEELLRIREKARNQINKVEIYKGRISGCPQNYISESLVTSQYFQDDCSCNLQSVSSKSKRVDQTVSATVLNGIFGVSVGSVLLSAFINKRNKTIIGEAEECTEDLLEELEKLKEIEVKIKRAKNETKELSTKVFQYLLKLQAYGVDNYREFNWNQQSDFKTMINITKILEKQITEVIE